MFVVQRVLWVLVLLGVLALSLACGASKSDLEMTQADLTAAKTQLATAIADLNKIKADLAAATADLAKTKADLTSATTGIQADVTKLKDGVSTATADLSRTRADLTATTSSLQGETKKLSDALTRAEAELARVKVDLGSTATSLQGDVKKIRDQLIAAQADLAQTEKNLAATGKSISDLSASAQSTRQDLDSVRQRQTKQETVSKLRLVLDVYEIWLGVLDTPELFVTTKAALADSVKATGDADLSTLWNNFDTALKKRIESPENIALQQTLSTAEEAFLDTLRKKLVEAMK